jgi:hypothetical protein
MRRFRPSQAKLRSMIQFGPAILRACARRLTIRRRQPLLSKVPRRCSALVASIRDHSEDPRPERCEAVDQVARGEAVGDASRLDATRDEETLRIDERLAALDALVPIGAAKARLSVILTDWLSMIATNGSGRRPDCLRAAR